VIGRVHPNTGLLAASVAVVLVPVDHRPESAPDGELLELRWVTRSELRELLRGDEPVDGLTASAFALLVALEQT
jgi:hypothetical protein